MDFRGYVQQKAPEFLGFVGNDGGVNVDKLNKAGGVESNYKQQSLNTQGALSAIDELRNSYQQSQNSPNNNVGGGGSLAVAAPKVDANFVNQAYNTKIAGLKSVIDTLDPQQQAATLNINNQFQNQSNALQVQKAQGQRNLQMAGEQVQAGKARSLNDIRDQVQTMGMSYNNQLGAYGAGDSSAAGLIQQALSGQASKNRGEVLQNAAQQDQAITLQGQDLENEFTTNMRSLEDWKTASLNDVATKFLQQKQAIQQQMIGADADRYQALAQADASYTQQAIQQLAQLENVYKQQATDLNAQYQSLMSPQASLNSNLLQYQVNPISAGQIGQLQALPEQSSAYSTDPSTYGGRRFDEDYGFSLQPGY